MSFVECAFLCGALAFSSICLALMVIDTMLGVDLRKVVFAFYVFYLCCLLIIGTVSLISITIPCV